MRARESVARVGETLRQSRLGVALLGDAALRTGGRAASATAGSLDPEHSHRLLIYTAQPASESAEKLRLLAAPSTDAFLRQVPDAAASTRTLDLASLDSVHALVSHLRHEGRPVHVLVNNAGVMTPPTRRETAGPAFRRLSRRTAAAA